MIINDVDRDIKPEELSRRIIEQNPELDLTLEEASKIIPKFKTGPRDKDYVHWVCEVQPEVFRRINHKRVYLSYSLCKVTEFLSITICNKC